MSADAAARRECPATLTRSDGRTSPGLLAFAWRASDPLVITARVSIFMPDGSAGSEVWTLGREWLGDLVRHGAACSPVPGTPEGEKLDDGLYLFTLYTHCGGYAVEVEVKEIDVLAFLVATEALVPAGSPTERRAVGDDLDAWLTAAGAA